MDLDDYEEFYRHIRTALQTSGRSELDIRILESQRLYDARGSREEVASYLEALRQELILGSSGVLRQTMERFRSVQSPSGQGVTGIVVDVREQDRASYGGHGTIDLVGSVDLDGLAAEIDELLASVHHDGIDE